MSDLDYMKRVVGTVFGAVVSIPGIALGFYVTYQVVTALGN